MKQSKAYQVQEPDEGTAAIVLAKSGAEARRVGANQLNIGFDDVDFCRRVGEFDKWAVRGKVPAESLLTAGWWFTCHQTGERVSLEDCPDLYISDTDGVYVNFGAYEADLKEFANRAIKRLSAIRKTRRKFPFAEKINYSHSKMMHPNSRESIDCISFRFPGQTGQSATWLIGTDICFVSRCDNEVWCSLVEKHCKKLP